MAIIKVAIVEDNEIIREGIAALINGTTDYMCVGSYADCETYLEELMTTDIDVVLMDIQLGGMTGIEGIRESMQKKPSLNILMLTVYEDDKMIFEALCAGASGYLVKKTPPIKLLEAIREAYEGGSPMSSHIARRVIKVFQKQGALVDDSSEINLTSREKEILLLLSQGCNYNEIGEKVFIALDTVRHHIRNIYRKLHVHSQSEAVAKAIRKGII
ncbi:MAG: response regulator transcription factor [Ignavibacteria bacterium]|nr:response regulator transcription factor [Ignavibacteria bacterium]